MTTKVVAKSAKQGVKTANMNIEKLNEIKNSVAEKIALRRGEAKNGKREIIVCSSTGCQSCESMKVVDALKAAIRERALSCRLLLW
jgi:thioredoxin-related protein